MSGGVKRALAGGCLLLAVLFFWCLGASALGRAAPFMRTVSLRYDGGDGVALDQWREVQRRAKRQGEALPGVTLWLERRGEFFSSAHEAAGTWLVCDGDAAVVLPTGFLRGSAPAADDPEGCAVSAALAYDLWGTDDAVGLPVTLNGGSYTVRGVFAGAEPIALTQAGGEEGETLFPRAELRFPGSRNAGADASAFLTQWGLPFPAATVDGSWYALLLNGLLFLPAWLAAALLLIRLWRGARRLRAAPLLHAAGLIAALALFGGVLLALGLISPFPERLIPSMWSDFSFWGELWGKFTMDLKALFSLALSVRERAFLTQALVCAASTCAAGLLLGAVMAKVRVTGARQLLGGALLCVAAAFAFTWLLPADAPGLERAIWLTLPVWLAVDWLLHWWDGFLAAYIDEKGGGADDAEQAPAIRPIP